MRLFTRHPQPNQPGGYILLTVVVAAMVLSMLGLTATQMLINNARFTSFEEKQSSALNIAEAGINYYLWHLAHNPADYKDGNSTPAAAPYGPYVHNYYDNDGKLKGTYELWITPASSGSTVTTIKSIGKAVNLPGARVVLAQVGQPSFANYVLLTATEVWFGPSESTTGPVHSNVGVHFDGLNNGPVYSAQATYKPTPSFGGDGTIKNGVWGTGGPQSQWQFPVPSIDFSKITTDLQSYAALATADGVALPNSSGQGYYLKLRTDGTIDVYKVNNETSSGLNTTFLYNKNPPNNGMFYVADSVWVEGTNFPGRMTIAAARFPDNSSTNSVINIVGDITYSTKDGSDALGFISQKDIHVADYAPTNLEINGALLAQKGHVWVDSNAPVKNKITVFGAIASYDYWTWTWVNGSNVTTAGYNVTETNFDSHLIYAPPPFYPTTGNYSILNWREQLFSP
jgi:hypothetical protein